MAFETTHDCVALRALTITQAVTDGVRYLPIVGALYTLIAADEAVVEVSAPFAKG